MFPVCDRRKDGAWEPVNEHEMPTDLVFWIALVRACHPDSAPNASVTVRIVEISAVRESPEDWASRLLPSFRQTLLKYYVQTLNLQMAISESINSIN